MDKNEPIMVKISLVGHSDKTYALMPLDYAEIMFRNDDGDTVGAIRLGIEPDKSLILTGWAKDAIILSQ